MKDVCYEGRRRLAWFTRCISSSSTRQGLGFRVQGSGFRLVFGVCWVHFTAFNTAGAQMQVLHKDKL